jgi:nickel-type superoxide dismutase maturation protease
MFRHSIKCNIFFNIVLCMIGRRRRFIIQGESMLPTLPPGKWIFVEDGYYTVHSPQINDLVLVYHPDKKGVVMVKRISAIEGNNVMVIGDNLHSSTDSRHFGSVGVDQLKAKVWSVL